MIMWLRIKKLQLFLRDLQHSDELQDWLKHHNDELAILEFEGRFIADNKRMPTYQEFEKWLKGNNYYNAIVEFRRFFTRNGGNPVLQKALSELFINNKLEYMAAFLDLSRSTSAFFKKWLPILEPIAEKWEKERQTRLWRKEIDKTEFLLKMGLGGAYKRKAESADEDLFPTYPLQEPFPIDDALKNVGPIIRKRKNPGAVRLYLNKIHDLILLKEKVKPVNFEMLSQQKKRTLELFDQLNRLEDLLQPPARFQKLKSRLPTPTAALTPENYIILKEHDSIPLDKDKLQEARRKLLEENENWALRSEQIKKKVITRETKKAYDEKFPMTDKLDNSKLTYLMLYPELNKPKSPQPLLTAEKLRKAQADFLYALTLLSDNPRHRIFNDEQLIEVFESHRNNVDFVSALTGLGKPSDSSTTSAASSPRLIANTDSVRNENDAATLVASAKESADRAITILRDVTKRKLLSDVQFLEIYQYHRDNIQFIAGFFKNVSSTTMDRVVGGEHFSNTQKPSPITVPDNRAPVFINEQFRLLNQYGKGRATKDDTYAKVRYAHKLFQVHTDPRLRDAIYFINSIESEIIADPRFRRITAYSSNRSLLEICDIIEECKQFGLEEDVSEIRKEIQMQKLTGTESSTDSAQVVSVTEEKKAVTEASNNSAETKSHPLKKSRQDRMKELIAGDKIREVLQEAIKKLLHIELTEATALDMIREILLAVVEKISDANFAGLKARDDTCMLLLRTVEMLPQLKLDELNSRAMIRADLTAAIEKLPRVKLDELKAREDICAILLEDLNHALSSNYDLFYHMTEVSSENPNFLELLADEIDGYTQDIKLTTFSSSASLIKMSKILDEQKEGSLSGLAAKLSVLEILVDDLQKTLAKKHNGFLGANKDAITAILDNYKKGDSAFNCITQITDLCNHYLADKRVTMVLRR